MPILEFVCDLNAPLERVWAFHNTVESLFKLTPPDKQARLLGKAEPMRAGVVYHIQVRQFGLLPITLQSLIRDYTPPNGFVDVQVPGKGPFKSWEHQHRLTVLSPDCTRLTDHITYEMPFGPFGALADRLFVRRDITKMFAYRHQVTRHEVEKES